MADPEHRASRILLSSKKTAKRKNIPFSLQPSDIVDALRRGVCEATGMPLSMTTLDRNDPWRPSIDRIIPSNGYVPGNVRIVVWMYNAAKQQYCDSDVIAMARAIVGKHGLSEERVA
jgi:hypothetical protein